MAEKHIPGRNTGPGSYQITVTRQEDGTLVTEDGQIIEEGDELYLLPPSTEG